MMKSIEIRKGCLMLFFVSLLMGTSLWRLQAQSVRMEVKTNKGSFRLMLYDDTPLHRDRFVELVKKQAYNGTLFHRVIEMFVVQGGNLMTQNKKGKEVDVSEDTMTFSLPAELMPEKHFHKRGALCAARESDEVNPEKRSSGSQFYIVTGDYYTDHDLDRIEERKQLRFTPEQREAYKTQGGTPSLDGSYTVFGEVISGMEIVERIERVSTNSSNQPDRDVVIKSIVILP